MKRIIVLMFMLCILIPAAFAETEPQTSALDSIGGWFSQAAEDTADWATKAWEDTSDGISAAACDVWNWTKNTAAGAWNGIEGFFDPPSTEGTPSIVAEPELPEGTLKMYMGYPVVKTGLDNGYCNTLEIGKKDPHFGLSVGKFYVSGFTGVTGADSEHFTFLKTVGDHVELHFELTQDIDMLNNDTFLTINRDVGGYDRQFGIPPTDFGRGTLIVRFTDHQNNTGEPQIYTDYLAAKQSGSADTVIALNEEGDYEVALDYEIKKDDYILGTAATKSSCTNYRIHFSFSVRNGNAMVFPFDAATGAELMNTAVAENGFYLDLARSRYLDINVRHSVITRGAAGMIEDTRFNRPAKDGDRYTSEGIYTITVNNRYTGDSSEKTIFVGSEALLQEYIENGFSLDRLK